MPSLFKYFLSFLFCGKCDFPKVSSYRQVKRGFDLLPGLFPSPSPLVYMLVHWQKKFWQNQKQRCWHSYKKLIRVTKTQEEAYYYFFFPEQIHSCRAVTSQRMWEQALTFQLRFSKEGSFGGGFQCEVFFLPNLTNLCIFTTGKQLAWFFTAAFWVVLGHFTFVGLRSIKAEISGRFLYCCCKVGSLSTLMSPTCGKLANRMVEAENWGGEELAWWTSGSLFLSMISPVS